MAKATCRACENGNYKLGDKLSDLATSLMTSTELDCYTDIIKLLAEREYQARTPLHVNQVVYTCS